MELFIQIKDGMPFQHPILGDNFRSAFPDVDVNNLPLEFARFERIARPLIEIYQTFDFPEVTYELVDGIYKDVWHVRDMTDAEKTTKQQLAKDKWAQLPDRDNFSAWTFNEAICWYEAPIPCPSDDKYYLWQGTTLTWLEYPPYPTDEKTYKIDYVTASWVMVNE